MITVDNILPFILGLLISIFGLVLTVLERKLIVTRKAVVGQNAFSITVVGCILGTGGTYMLTENYILAGIYALIVLVIYKLICYKVKKVEYPEEERFTKEY